MSKNIYMVIIKIDLHFIINILILNKYKLRNTTVITNNNSECIYFITILYFKISYYENLNIFITCNQHHIAPMSDIEEIVSPIPTKVFGFSIIMVGIHTNIEFSISCIPVSKSEFFSPIKFAN